jgi:hypothetical protein
MKQQRPYPEIIFCFFGSGKGQNKWKTYFLAGF